MKVSEVTHSQVVELITAGRSGTLGLAPADACLLYTSDAADE